MSGWRSKVVNDVLQDGHAMNVYGRCLFSTFAKESDTGVHGDTVARDSYVGGVLLEVDNLLMGGPGHARHDNITLGKWHRLVQVGESLSGCRHVTQDVDWGFPVAKSVLHVAK